MEKDGVRLVNIGQWALFPHLKTGRTMCDPRQLHALAPEIPSEGHPGVVLSGGSGNQYKLSPHRESDLKV